MIKTAAKEDVPVLARLAVCVRNGHSAAEMEAEYSELLSQEEASLFLALCEGEEIGFAQCQLRHDYVEGTKSSPVGYLEGIFVKPEFRHRGYAKKLLQACETWAMEMGCREFASDCELGNANSFLFHKSVGFTEVNRVICFTKPLK